MPRGAGPSAHAHRHGPAGGPPVVRPPTSRRPAADRATGDAQAQYRRPESGERTRCSTLRAGQDFVSDRAQLAMVWLTRALYPFPIGGGDSNCEEGTPPIVTFAVRSSLDVATQRKRVIHVSCPKIANGSRFGGWARRARSRGLRDGACTPGDELERIVGGQHAALGTDEQQHLLAAGRAGRARRVH